MLSVIIPTLNAAGTLGRTLACLADAGEQPVRELIVVDGGSTDDSRQIAAEGGAIVLEAPRGRGIQLREGATAAGGDWLLFLHADTVLSGTWAGVVTTFMDDPRNRDRAGHFQFALDDGARAARRVEWAVAWRCRLFALPYGDQGLLISRPLYESLGGFSRMPLMEDVDLVRRIGRRRLCQMDAKALTSAVRYRQDGYVARPIRNFACLMLYSLGVPSRYIVTLYR